MLLAEAVIPQVATATSQVEMVATWAGLISGIVGVALSVVAIWFTFAVNRRSEEVTQHTVQSLQKIESTVERLSSDTTGLIKAAWDKMIGSMSRTALESAEEDERLVSGATAEIREEIAEADQDASATEVKHRLDRIEETLLGLSDAIAASAVSRVSGATAMDRLVSNLSALSDRARALVHAIQRAHLTRAQFTRLRRAPEMEPVIRELRRAGLLVPLRGHDLESWEEISVYFFPPSVAERIPAALALAPPPSDSAKATVRAALDGIGYKAH